jgi:hypothetical protein
MLCSALFVALWADLLPSQKSSLAHPKNRCQRPTNLLSVGVGATDFCVLHARLVFLLFNLKISVAGIFFVENKPPFEQCWWWLLHAKCEMRESDQYRYTTRYR